MKRTYIKSFALRLTGAALGLVVTMMLARLLSTKDFGFYSTMLSLLSLLAIPISAGLPAMLTRESGIASSTGRADEVRPLIVKVSTVACYYGGVVAIILVLLSVTNTIVMTWFQVLLLSLAILFVGLDLLRGGAMRGLGSAIGSQIPENLVRPASMILALALIVLLTRELTVTGALIAYILAGITSYLVGVLLLGRLLPPNASKGPQRSLVVVLKQSVGPTLLSGTSTVLANTDLLVLSVLGSFEEAGIYRVALQGVVVILMIQNSVNAVAQRDLAGTLAGGAIEASVPYVHKATYWSTIGTLLVCIAVFLFGESIINIFFGGAFTEAYIVLLILSIGHLVSAMLGPVTDILMMLKKQSIAVGANLIGLVTFFAIAMLWTSSHPLIVVAVGSSIANILRRVIMALHIRTKLGIDTTVFGSLRWGHAQKKATSLEP